MRAKIIAVDFDGTLIEEGKWPGIGATNEKVLGYCKSEQKKGARIILWTNRVGEPLENAVKWCEEHGLHLDAVNDNVQESIDFYGFNTRKIYADEFIDDRMLQVFDLPYGEQKEPEKILAQKVIEDMCSLSRSSTERSSARKYYYDYYATEEERKAMDREDKFETTFVTIFTLAFWALVGFAIISFII